MLLLDPYYRTIVGFEVNIGVLENIVLLENIGWGGGKYEGSVGQG